jgi:hypothetical protein
VRPANLSVVHDAEECNAEQIKRGTGDQPVSVIVPQRWNAYSGEHNREGGMEGLIQAVFFAYDVG